MASGIAVSPECISAYSALSKRVHSHIIFKVVDDMTEVQVERKGPPCDDDPEAQWKDFIKTLPEDDCRYIICDFSWKETPTVTKSKIIMILWSPEYAPIRSKMIYAASQEAVTTKTPVHKSMQANETDDILYHVVKDAIGN